MGRNRSGVRGTVTLTPTGLWQGHWYEYSTEGGAEKRTHHTKVLGSKGEMRKSEAEDALRSHIASRAQPAEAAAADQTFGWFARERYWKLHESTWRRKTRDGNRFVFEKLLLPAWGNTPLRELDKVAVQAWLGEIAQKYSASAVDKARVYLKAICEEAIDQGYLERNPCRKLRMPSELRKSNKDTLTVEQIRRLLAAMGSDRDRLILRLFLIGGFRRQELFALRWDDWDGRTLRVDETVEMSAVVNATKTRGSRALVGISTGLEAELRRWFKQSGRRGPLDFIFPSATGGHISPENWVRRNLAPAAKTAKIPHVNYQMLRRTFATLAPGAGISLKHISEQMRHGTIATTADKYMQPVERALLDGLDSLDASLKPRRKPPQRLALLIDAPIEKRLR